MTLYYLIADPADVRDLEGQVTAWNLAGNPKAGDWAIQPLPSSDDAIWSNGAWVIPSPALTPNWGRFKAAILSNTAINAALAQALPLAPAAATALAPTLLQCEQGQTADFAAAWAAVLAVAPVGPEVLADLVALAADCHLPVEFVTALTPAAT